jgi:hypothetical protein
MSRKTQMVLVIVLSVVLWAVGVFFLYRSYSTPRRIGSPSPNVVVTLGKPLEFDAKTGKWVEKSFLEAKAAELTILTFVCGAASLLVIVRALKKQTRERTDTTG